MVVTQRKYICSFCAKAFSRAEHRIRHERSHTGYKPFQCMLCQHSFVRRDLAQRHIKTVHKYLLLNNKDVLLNIARSLDGSIDNKNKNKNKNNSMVPPGFDIMAVLKDSNIDLAKNSNLNYNNVNNTTHDPYLQNSQNGAIGNGANPVSIPLTKDELSILDKLVKFFVSYKNTTIHDSKSLKNKLKQKIGELSLLDTECNNNQTHTDPHNIHLFSNDLSSGPSTFQDIQKNSNHIDDNNTTEENQSVLDTSLLCTQIDPDDIKWINYINNTVLIGLRNQFPSVANFKASDLIMYFNQGYKFILGCIGSQKNNIRDTSCSSSNNLLLFVHYLTHAFKNLESLWGTNTLNNNSNNNDHKVYAGTYNDSNKNVTLLPLSIVYLGCLLNDTVNYQLWNDLWLSSLKDCFYDNQIEQIVTSSLLIFGFIQQYILLNERGEEYAELYSVRSPLLKQIFDNYQFILFNSIKSNIDFNSKNFNQWDFNSLVLIWSSFLQLFDGNHFDDLSSKIYFEIINKKFIWNHFHCNSLKDLIQIGIDHLVNEYIPKDLLICFPSLLYLEAQNNRLLNRGKIVTLGNFKSTEDLHNLIIKINQCYIQNDNTSDQFNEGPSGVLKISPDSTDKQFTVKAPNFTNSIPCEYTIKDIDSWRRKLITSVTPQRFKPIIKSYAIIPNTLLHWLLIEVTWFEFIRNFSNTEYIFKKDWYLDNIISKTMFFDPKSINNNLSICSLPVILLVIIPTTHCLNVLSPRFKRFLPLIIDVLLVQYKLFSSELNESFGSNKNMICEFLLNPIVQLLLYVWYTIIYKMHDTTAMVYSQSEMDSVNTFMSKYIMNLKKHVDTDKLLEQDLDKILFDKECVEYIGFHHFLDRATSFIKNDLILNKLLSSTYLSDYIKFKVIEAIKEPNLDNNYIIPTRVSTNNTTTTAITNDNTVTNHNNNNNNSFDFVTTDEDPNSMMNPKSNESMFLKTKPVNFNSVQVPLHSLGNQHLMSPFMKRNSVPSNNKFVSRSTSSGKPLLTLAGSPVAALSPYMSRRRSSVISVTDDGKNYLLPPLNFDPIQMDASNISSIHNSSSSVTLTNNYCNFYTNETSNGFNNNNTFVTLYNYSLRDAIEANPSNEKRRASVPIILPKSTFLTGSNGSNNNTNNPKKSNIIINNRSHSRTSSYMNNILRHPVSHSYINPSIPYGPAFVPGPTSLPNNHVLSRSAGGTTIGNAYSSSFINNSIDTSTSDGSSGFIVGNNLASSEDIPDSTLPLPSPSQLFGI